MEKVLKSRWVLEKVRIGDIITLEDGVNTIGRNPSCTISVPSEFVSRLHAEIHINLNAGCVKIKDLGSTNGVFINEIVYANTTCTLKEGDKIGIGVSVDDDQISNDGKYPIFILKTISPEKELQAENVENGKSEDNITIEISDIEYDEEDKEDDFVQPQGLNNRPTLPKSFGTLSADRGATSNLARMVDSTAAPTNKSALNNGVAKIVHDESNLEIIDLSSDDEDNRAGITKSPELFEDCLNIDEEENGSKSKEVDINKEPSTKIDEKVNQSKSMELDPNKEPATKVVITSIPSTNASSLPVKQVSDPKPTETSELVEVKKEFEYDDEMFFTQRLLDDIREELPDADNDVIILDDDGVPMAPVKQEHFSQRYDENLDDDFDEVEESKVNDWSFKLFSQSFSNHCNTSQVYEDGLDGGTATLTEAIFIIDDEDEHDEDKSRITKEKESQTIIEKKIDDALVTDVIPDNAIENAEKDREHSKENTVKPKPKAIEELVSPSLPDENDDGKKLHKKHSTSKDHKDASHKRLRSRSHSKEPKKIRTERRSTTENKSSKRSTEHEHHHSKDRKERAKTSEPSSKKDQEIHKSENDKTTESSSKKDQEIHKPENRSHSRPRSSNDQSRLKEISQIKLIDPVPLKNLKRKCVESPRVEKKKAKEEKKVLKEDRKHKLRELADKKNSIENQPRENNNQSKEKSNSKNLKVKNTPFNRGLCLTINIPSISEMKSTKQIKKAESSSLKPKTYYDNSNEFSKELSKCDAVIKDSYKQVNSVNAPKKHAAPEKGTSTRSVSEKSTSEKNDKNIQDTQAKQRAPPRRNTNKLTFGDMEKHFQETYKAKEAPKILTDTISDTVPKDPLDERKKKTVRFNLEPQIRYIERVVYANRRVNRKDTSMYHERRHIIRRNFSIVDCTGNLINDVLLWSKEFLRKSKSGVPADAIEDPVYPMTHQFSSINNYKNTLLPLLKIEFLSHLDRHLQDIDRRPRTKLQACNLTPHERRELLYTSCPGNGKQICFNNGDLVLLDIVFGSITKHIFAFVGSIRKADNVISVVFEIITNQITKDEFKGIESITARRVIESIRVYFGSMNAVHQLEQTPLFHKILNPIEITNVKIPPWENLQYKGCDQLNDEQKAILMQTYAKEIEKFNPSITLIKGPPGTGKSRVITNLALQLLYGDEIRMLDKKILICAQSNMAVDVIAYRLYVIQKKLSETAQKYHVVRFGNDNKVHPDVLDITVHRLIARDHKAKASDRMVDLEHSSLSAGLQKEIEMLEAQVTELMKETLLDVRQDELRQTQRDLLLKRKSYAQQLTHEEEKRLFLKYLERANIICTTLSSCVKLSHYVDYFDVCIIDEATQCIEPWTIMPLRFGVNSLVLVGDVQQLPATVISEKARNYGLETSLFTRIQRCFEILPNEIKSPVVGLNVQYRMHPEISKWPNLYFYQNKLVDSPKTTDFNIVIQPFSILSLEYNQNTNCENGQISNNLEADFVVKLVMTLNKYIPNKHYSYGIVTPYAQHKDRLDSLFKKSGLPDVMIRTIDAYQGIEKDVIIISNARTQGVGFLANYQRLNVALTRSRKCLIMCGNFKNLEHIPSWMSLLANARERGVLHNISLSNALDVDNYVINKIKWKGT